MDRRRQRAHRANRSNVQNLALALADHLFVDRLGDGKQTAYVCANYFIPGFISRGGEIIAAIYRGIVYQNIESAGVKASGKNQIL